MKITCFRIQNGALAAKELPKRLKVLGWGDNPACFGINPRLGEHSRKRFPILMKQKGLDKVPIDFEHNTVKGTSAHAEAIEPRKVAGYGTPLLIPGDGLFLDDIVWTPCGSENALNYIDLSPACHIEPRTGEVDYLHSVALTRAGAVEGLSFYSVESTQEGATNMKWLLAWLGKDEGTTNEDLAAAFSAKIATLSAEAVAAQATRIEALETKLETLSADQGGETLTTLTADLAAVKGDVTKLSGELARRDREALVAQATREGKVIPLSADQVAAMDLTVLRDLVGKLPVTVPLDRRTPEHIQSLSVDAASPALESIARRCGLDPKQVVELNKG